MMEPTTAPSIPRHSESSHDISGVLANGCVTAWARPCAWAGTTHPRGALSSSNPSGARSLGQKAVESKGAGFGPRLAGKQTATLSVFEPDIAQSDPPWGASSSPQKADRFRSAPISSEIWIFKAFEGVCQEI